MQCRSVRLIFLEILMLHNEACRILFNLSIMQFGVGNMAILTIPTALIMIGVSIFLNVMSGLIPALKASSQDPVVALRTE